MENRTDFNITALMRELDSAVLSGDIEKADKLTAVLFRLQGGTENDTVMPDQFPMTIALNK